jgi:multidrug efflux pump subunit AcrA (membrane-fusion protein)
VTVEALPDVELTGVIASIAPVASIEGGVISYDVVIELADTDASIRADMTANATIKVKELTDVLKIPTWVVRVDRDTGQMYVHRRAGGTFERVDISLGVREGGFVQVMDGLSEGDEVVRLEDDAASGFPRQ